MRRTIACSAILATVTQANAQVVPSQRVADTHVLQAIRDDLAPEVTSWLARNAEPTEFAPDKYPDLQAQTAEDVARTLCGGATSAFWNEFRTENGIEGEFDPKAKLGSKAYEYHWPACFYIERGQFEHLVRRGDSAASVYARETGSGGKGKTYSHFFSGSDVAELAKVVPGDVLRYSFRTQPVTATPRGRPKLFLKRLGDVASAEFGAVSEAVKTEQPPALVEGEIVLAAQDQGSIATTVEPPADCLGRGGLAFDLQHASAAFGYGPKARPDNIQVVVVDNGFFGATRTNGKVTFGPKFANGFFRIFDHDGSETIGPTLSWESGRKVSPFNRENGFADQVVPDAESGHGTHVVGLIAGAASTDAVLFGNVPATAGSPTFDPTTQRSWLQVTVVAFSPGKRAISNYTVPQFNEAIRQLRLFGAHVVNMSIKFGGGSYSQLRGLVTNREDTLFVVAAGNDGADLNKPNARVYPAMLGRGEANVLAVGAEDGGGNLSAFSNRGADFIDLVAPGCNLRSSLDGSGETPLSGTSQAAPIVTLAAALLARQGYRGKQIKMRLVHSGDLITGLLAKENGVVGTTTVIESTPVPVRSRSRLNLAKAQFAKYDYIRFRDTDGIVIEAIGTLGARSGPDCGRDRPFQDVVAFKRLPSDSSGWCFWRDEPAPSAIKSPDTASLDFDIEAVLDHHGVPQPSTRSLEGIQLTRVDEFVMSVERAETTWTGE